MSTPADAQMSTEASRARPEERVRDWWRATISGADGDRGARAQLRRCRTPLDAVTVPAALALARRLGRVPEPGAPAWKQKGFERALVVAVVVAHVREDVAVALLRALGWATFPGAKTESEVPEGRPALSELRFRRLLQTQGSDALIPAFARLVALAGGKADVMDLARVLLGWDEDRTKRDLALTYFHANARGFDGRD